MLIPFALASYSGRSISLNAERLINLFPEEAPQRSTSQVILRSTPGLMQFAVVGVGPIRGLHRMNISNAATLFVVSGTDLYEVSSTAVVTLRGSAGFIAGTGDVFMASNANDELVITNSAGTGYIWDGTLLQRISVLDADFTDDATSLTFLDQFILYSKANTGQVFASDLNNAKSWNSLSFDTAESAPDNLVQCFAHAGNLWLFGERTTEVYFNSAATPFAFARIGGAVLEDVGGVSGTVASVDQAIYWLANDGIVYRASGVQPTRISDHGVEFRIRGRTGARAWTYKDEGHAFYVLGFDTGNAEVYDAATGLWHERSSFAVGRWRADSYASVYGKHLVGDYQLGIVYEMSLENFADGANALQRQAISFPIGDGVDDIEIPAIQVMFEHGVGITGPPATEFFVEEMLDESGAPLLAEDELPLLVELSKVVEPQGSDPQVVLQHSDDGGKTFGNERWAGIGKIGEYRKRATWRRNGQFKQRNFKLTYTEPTKFAIYGGKEQQ